MIVICVTHQANPNFLRSNLAAHNVFLYTSFDSFSPSTPPGPSYCSMLYISLKGAFASSHFPLLHLAHFLSSLFNPSHLPITTCSSVVPLLSFVSTYSSSSSSLPCSSIPYSPALLTHTALANYSTPLHVHTLLTSLHVQSFNIHLTFLAHPIQHHTTHVVLCCM